MIFIPSYKRPEACKAARLLSKAVICCHACEVKAYRKYNRNKILSIPDSLAGKGMAVIRNWILDNSKDKNVMMIDDDVSAVGYFENQDKCKFTEDQIYRIVRDGFRMSRELGTVLWGVNLLDDKKAYREYSPFSFKSVVLGPFMGIIKNTLRFDETLGLKEDFDYSIQVLNKYRRILRFNKYHYVTGHIIGTGGCTSYRTSAAEKIQKQRFIKKWGSGIIKFKDGDLNPVVTVPITGI